MFGCQRIVSWPPSSPRTGFETPAAWPGSLGWSRFGSWCLPIWPWPAEAQIGRPSGCVHRSYGNLGGNWRAGAGRGAGGAGRGLGAGLAWERSGVRRRSPPWQGGGEGGGVERTWKGKEWGGEGLAGEGPTLLATTFPRRSLSFQLPTQFKAAGPERLGEKAAAQTQQGCVTSFGNPWEISEPSRRVVFHFGHPLVVGLLLRAEESERPSAEPRRFELWSRAVSGPGSSALR